MNLGKNVHNLLKRQPEVFIKGLGAFKRNHTPAAYDEKRDIYLPPISYIDFDQASTRGHDFIAYFAQLESIDLQSAEHQVSLAVKSLLHSIQEEGQAKLDDLGYLVSYGGGYVFKALDLSGFNYEPVEGIKPAGNPLLQDVETERLSETTVPIEQAAVPKQQPVPEEILQPFFENDRFSAKRTGGNALWYIVIAVLALGIIAALYYFNRTVSTSENAVIVVEAPEDTVKSAAPAMVNVDSTMREDSLARTLEDTVINTTPVAEVPQKVINKKHNWQIVIGTHRTIDQAEEHAAAMHNKGYDKVRVIPSNMAKNKKKVIWDSYETKQEMETALQYVRKNIEKDAWPDKIN
ncbi:hypothetical protein [Sphingobacterium deserti]|uniref:Sporulation domain-containing protein n=1 Tax=Sphingobacterium deserti TaxID=1229276 RepID=A0A0B8T6R4_9SPHI|nr:hypothetical protein [Sphingobacterium deserti]KGE13834.1 sporulation domain-containing protein [Sphingobacterium deserti]